LFVIELIKTFPPEVPGGHPKAAIFKARTRLGPKVMAELVAEVAKPRAAPGSSGFTNPGDWSDWATQTDTQAR
jgi:hypothetical protein